MAADAYPLEWPAGWPRTKQRERNYQFKMSDGAMIDHLYQELERLGAESIVVSSNVQTRIDGRPLAKQRAVDDPGVAVYFKLKGHDQCIPCDKWDSPIHNLHAVGLAIQAIRGFERWGTGQMVEAAFRGFTALPASAGAGFERPQRSWHMILEVSPNATREVIEAAYKAKRRATHPDMPSGSEAAFNEVQRAFEEAPKQ